MDRQLLTLQMKEEWRVMTSYFSSEKLFFLFPVIIFFVGFFMGLLLPLFKSAFDMRELLVAFTLLLGAYGLFVGAFGFFADEVAQRWFREARLLISMYDVLPLSFRRIFTWFYVKDIIYYLFLTIFPLFLGVFLSFKINHTIFLKVMVTSVLSFLVGVSVSFVISSVYVRNRFSLIVVLLVLAALYSVGFSYTDFPPLHFLFNRDLLSLGLSVLIFLIFSLFSLIITQPTERAPRKAFLKSDLFSRIDPLTAKEVIDLKRSGTWQIMITSYLFPLFFLYGIFYFSGRLFQFEITIPLLFYAVFIGYLSTLVYSWLHNIDTPSFMSTLPVTTAELIKRKIRLFLLTSFTVSVVYLVILGYLLNDVRSLPLSVVSMGSTTFYVAAVTAWLCGLYPNSRLFDGSVLARYLVGILPVLVFLSILSLMRESVGILVVSLVILIFSSFVYVKLDKKYGDVYL